MVVSMHSTLMTKSLRPGPNVASAWLDVDEFDGDEVLAWELEHGQLAQRGLGNLPTTS